MVDSSITEKHSATLCIHCHSISGHNTSGKVDAEIVSCSPPGVDRGDLESIHCQIAEKVKILITDMGFDNHQIGEIRFVREQTHIFSQDLKGEVIFHRVEDEHWNQLASKYGLEIIATASWIVSVTAE